MKTAMQKLLFEVQFDNDSSPYRTRQNSDIYLRKFTAFRKSIIQNLQEYITVEVVQKEPPRYYSPIMTRGTNNLYHDLKHNKLVHFPRKDSFQIYIDNFLVFSKLQSGMWPSVSTITQWAFKVAEKMLDLQIQRETGSIKDSRKDRAEQLESAAANYEKSNGKQQLVEDQVLRPATLDEQKLPRINQGEGRNSIISNYTTLPVKAMPKEPIFEQKGSNNEGLPKGFSYASRDMQKTQQMFKQSNKQQQRRRYKLNQEQQTVYYTDSKSRPKNQSFHWNIGTPRRLSLGKQTIRVNAQNPKQPLYRNKNVELSPLPAQVKAQRDKINSSIIKTTEKSGNQIQKIELKISDSILNTNTSSYQIQGNKIIKKKKNNIWSPIVCQNLMPLKGQYYISFAVIHSRENNIQIGIAPLSYFPKPQISEIEQIVICYNCSNGKIKDSKLNEISNSTSWRLGGESAPEKKPYQMRLSVDAESNYIDWYIEQTIVASSKISKPFQQGFRVFISLQNTEDYVLLNEENWKQKIFKQNDNISLIHQIQQEIVGRKGTIVHYQKHLEPMIHEQQHKSSQVSHSVYTMDQCVQTEYIGRIKHQRVAKLIEKRKKIQDSIQHSNIIKTSNNEIAQEQSSKFQSIKWKATYSQLNGFEIYENQENQDKPNKPNRRLLVETKQLPNKQMQLPKDTVTVSQKLQQLAVKPVLLNEPQKQKQENNNQKMIKQTDTITPIENHSTVIKQIEQPVQKINLSQGKKENKPQLIQPGSAHQIKHEQKLQINQTKRQTSNILVQQQNLQNKKSSILQKEKENTSTNLEQQKLKQNINSIEETNITNIERIQVRQKQLIDTSLKKQIYFPDHEHKWEAYYQENNYKIKALKQS